MSPAVAAKLEEKKSKPAPHPLESCESQQWEQPGGATAGTPMFLSGAASFSTARAASCGILPDRDVVALKMTQAPGKGAAAAKPAHGAGSGRDSDGARGPAASREGALPKPKPSPRKTAEARNMVRAAAGSAAVHARGGIQAGAEYVAGARAQANQAKASAAAQAATAMAAAKAPVFSAMGEVADPNPATTVAGVASAQALVRSLIASLNGARGSALAQIQTQSQGTRGELIAGANSVRQRVSANVAQETALLRAGFAAQRAGLASSMSAARTRVTAAAVAAQALAVAHGESAKASLTSLFAQQRATVEQTVQTNVAAAGDLRSHYAGYVDSRTQEQATDAQHRGAAKGATYPADERGGAQRLAAIGVADRTAREIREREPDTVSAIEKIVSGIPEQFESQGQHALSGLDQGLPDLLAKVDQQVEVLRGHLGQLGDQAHEQLEAVSGQLNEQLNGLETAIMARAEAIGQEAGAQVESSLAIALIFVDAGRTQASWQISEAVETATRTLAAAQHPSPKGARKLAQQVLGFVSAKRQRSVAAFGATGGSILAEIQEIGTTTSDGLQSVGREFAQDRQSFANATNSAIGKVVGGLNQSSQQAIQAVDASYAQAAGQVQASLGKATQKLKADFGKTFSDAERQVTQAVDQALGKNQEALGKLDAEMDEAADDAGWDYDHPVLATLRDIGELVAGVIVGILLVLALVVVFLVLAEVLIAGLVALGVSAATAALVVEIGGLALLAYGVYKGYESRAAKGQGGAEAFFGAIGDVTGITSIYRSVTTEGLTPYERGKMLGEGIASLGLLLVGGGEGESGEAGEAGGLGELGELGEGTTTGPPTTTEPTAPSVPDEPFAPAEPSPQRTPAPEEPTPGPSDPATPAPDKPVTPEEPVTPKQEPPATPAEPKPTEQPKPADEPKPAEQPKPTQEPKPGEEPAAREQPGREEVSNEDEHLEDAEDTEPYAPERQVICFPQGTLVSSVGGLRAIELLCPGDMVYSYDFEQRSVVPHRVLAVTKGSTARWIQIGLASGSVKSTRRHPFWVESAGEWVRAEELLPGMILRDQDGSLVEILTVEAILLEEREATYNLEVEEVNNFFVGAARVLVHNISPARLARLSRPGYSNYVLRAGPNDPDFKPGEIYYSGMFGPNETQAKVQYRHANNDSRFNPKNGDYMEIIAEDETYGTSRMLELQTALENDTIIGRDGANYRGNRQFPLSGDKIPEYLDYLEKCG